MAARHFVFRVSHSSMKTCWPAYRMVCICRRTEQNRRGISCICRSDPRWSFVYFLFSFWDILGPFRATDETSVTAVGDKSLITSKMEKWTCQRRLLVWLITPRSMSSVAIFPLSPLPPSPLNFPPILFPSSLFLFTKHCSHFPQLLFLPTLQLLCHHLISFPPLSLFPPVSSSSPPLPWGLQCV